MKGEWCYYTDFLSTAECEAIIASTPQSIRAQIGTSQSAAVDESYRRSNIAWLSKTEHKDLYSRIWGIAIEANREFFGFHIDDVENLQLTEYSAEYRGEYREHQDITWLGARQRKLSCVIQLTDSSRYSGGYLTLRAGQLPPQEIISKQGSVIFFPSFLYHAVTPVSEGVRHSLVAWFSGPAFK